MELALLRTLVAVADVGSFTAAAERLCVTQSAVSRRVRQLEDHYGVALLERGGETVRATPQGAALIAKARQMLDLERELAESIGLPKAPPRLSFCCTPCFGSGRLPDIFERFVSVYGVNFDFSINFQMPEDLIAGLLAERYDLAVVEHCEDMDLAGCRVIPLPSDEMLFVSAPSLGLVDADLALDRLTTRRVLLKTHNGCAYRFLRRNLKALGHEIEELHNLTYYDDLAGVIRQVVGGHGIGFVSRELAARELDAGLLIPHRIPGFDHVRARSLVFSPRCRPSDLVRQFITVFAAAMGIDLPHEFADESSRPRVTAE